ncbi:MAG: SCO family protein, partial [Variibacter sp.]
MGRLIVKLLGMALALSAASSAAASVGTEARESRLDRQQVLARSEAALGTQIGDHRLTDSQGRHFSLAEYRGRPLVISLIYTSCSSVCPTTTQHLLDAVEEARRSLGTDRFAVLTVGFDARHDTPVRLAAFARQQGISVA